MSLPQTVLDHTQNALELHLRSCLTCIHFKTRGRGLWLACELRPKTKELSKRFDDERAALALRRAGKCKYWEGDDA